MVVDKPAGMVVHPARRPRAGHARERAAPPRRRDSAASAGRERPGIVHRLDRGTSGVMVIAKHDRAHRALARQFHDREVEKEYLALVWGTPRAGETIDRPIGRDPRHRQKMSTRDRAARARRSRRSSTSSRSAACRWFASRFGTGRTHQIRVHLGEAGHPVVGDALYGGVRRRRAGPARGGRPAEPAVPARGAPGVRAPAPTDGRSRSRRRCPAIANEPASTAPPRRPATEPVARRAERAAGGASVVVCWRCHGSRRRRSSFAAACSASNRIACGCRTGARSARHRPPPRVGRLVPQPSRREVILIRQFRYAIGRWIWELPAGSLEPGEAPRTRRAAGVRGGDRARRRGASRRARRRTIRRRGSVTSA